MSEPSLAIQKALRARLIASPAVTALVPADAIFDRHGRPQRFPCIIIGEATSLYATPYESFHDGVTADLHLWTEEIGLTQVKEITGAVRAALRGDWNVEGFRCAFATVNSGRFIRDPDDEHSHGVLSISALLQEIADA
jgi:hypothetical protein